MIECSGLAIREADGWVALCPEYDIAADGRTFSEALGRLAGMIEMAVETAQEQKLAIGREVEPSVLAAFLANHIGEQRPVRRRWLIDTDLVVLNTVETELVR